MPIFPDTQSSVDTFLLMVLKVYIFCLFSKLPELIDPHEPRST